MRPRSSSRGRNTSASVTVTVTEKILVLSLALAAIRKLCEQYTKGLNDAVFCQEINAWCEKNHQITLLLILFQTNQTYMTESASVTL